LAEGAQVYLNDRLLLCDSTEHNPVLGSASYPGETAIIKALRTGALTTSEIDTLVQEKNISVMECLADMELADKIMFCSFQRN